MPGLNQKGPMGEGAMTGRRMGKCTNFGAKVRNEEQRNGVQSSENQQNRTASGERTGMGLGRGHRGMGRGVGSGGNGMGRRLRNRFGNGNN